MKDKLKIYENKLRMADTPPPFSISFSWGGEIITIELKEGKDVLKLASVFSLMLTENGIEHNIKQQENGE